MTGYGYLSCVIVSSKAININENNLSGFFCTVIQLFGCLIFSFINININAVNPMLKINIGIVTVDYWCCGVLTLGPLYFRPEYCVQLSTECVVKSPTLVRDYCDLAPLRLNHPPNQVGIGSSDPYLYVVLLFTSLFWRHNESLCHEPRVTHKQSYV